MFTIDVTGDYRDIANSAWISTLKEIRTKNRTDDDAKRVVKYLVEHHHTSPFECLTISVSDPTSESLGFSHYASDLYSRGQGRSFTIDLLNFIKVTYNNALFEDKIWREFEVSRPELAEMCSKFTSINTKHFTTGDVSDTLGSHGMFVELVSVHDTSIRSTSRATWRVKCPLSIAVQIVRHRKGSYNMVSGRYKTIRQELVPPVIDVEQIFNKAGMSLDRYLGSVDPVILAYNNAMKIARAAKDQEKITNDEYKRFREFARFTLPEGRMTELYITYYLDDFFSNYVLLRDSEHAQTEHIWVAQEMQRTLSDKGGIT